MTAVIGVLCQRRALSAARILFFGPWIVSEFYNSMRIFSIVILLFVMGCQTAPQKPKTARAEEVSALTTMTQGLTNQPITQAQLKNLAVQVAKDPQAQSAVRSINTALSPQHTVKYCPEDGERFSAEMIWCPDHKVKLEWVE